jgi:hypothetical protein
MSYSSLEREETVRAALRVMHQIILMKELFVLAGRELKNN